MRPSSASSIKLSDYVEPAFWVDHTALTFRLHPTETRVLSKITFRPNPNRAGEPHDLRLDGRNLKLISAQIDDRVLTEEECLTDAEGLTIPHDLVPQDGFVWRAEVQINPQGNSALEGLYLSNGMYCTQCEAQGFRKITYYPDRPDVMALFDVEIEGDAPVLLSNGNRLGHGKWHDPWPKPSYLFALVAGELVAHRDQFTTMTGRVVDLEIWVRDGDAGKCAYAMDALKRSMRWDEEVYGRAYDLDLFMIVAVDDFNMGAMENKGLNIFNSKYVLASPDTATDRDYELIEGIIAHEYFHNWTGNRITCRDWFQLCLKEGLTVFRDQQFTSDMRSKSVKRIEDVMMLRGRQFREDAGPLSHPVRPTEYIEINNFYTATVYEKGAEVIGMLKRIVGDDGYNRALTLYFDRHDGQACTIEDWIKVFEDACGVDLEQFAQWYSQSGTPHVKISRQVNDRGYWTVRIDQINPPTADQDEKRPLVLPLDIKLYEDTGTSLAPIEVQLPEPPDGFAVPVLQSEAAYISGPALAQNGAPLISAFRGFSAPVLVETDHTRAENLKLMAHDDDPFNKWDAGRRLATDILFEAMDGDDSSFQAYANALGHIIDDTNLDPAFRSLALTLPSEDTLAQLLAAKQKAVDPEKLYDARARFRAHIAQTLSSQLQRLYAEHQVDGSFDPNAKDAAKRALRSTCLGYLTSLDPKATLAQTQFTAAQNMTEKLNALNCLIHAGVAEAALADMYQTWQADKLVMDKWFMIQPAHAQPHTAMSIAQTLSKHPDFHWKNPNRFRSLIAGFVSNHAAFHQKNGDGYRFVVDWLIKLDAVNPQTTARMCGVFETWKRYDADRQNRIRQELARISATRGLSKDTAEIVSKILG